MAHFAKLGGMGKVIQVVVVDDKDMLNADGVEDESVGQQFLERTFDWAAQMWVQTSYNTIKNTHRLGGTPFRGNYAGIGFIWDEDNQIFWPKKPYPSWVKDLNTASWKSPIGNAPALTDEQENQNVVGDHLWDYNWNEATGSWDLVNLMA